MEKKQPQLPEFAALHVRQEKQLLETEAAKLPPGPAKIELQRRIRQLETATHINNWLASRGLRPPT